MLYERGWYAVTESLVALTIFRDEFDVQFVALFAFLLFMKTFHWLSKERVDFVRRASDGGVACMHTEADEEKTDAALLFIV